MNQLAFDLVSAFEFSLGSKIYFNLCEGAPLIYIKIRVMRKIG